MSAAAPFQQDPGLVRGACPSVHTPFVEPDGALVRVRLPGGRLPVEAAALLARLAADLGAGPFELTNRANLQLRALPVDAVTRVRDELVSSGVAPPDSGADERRNVLASPTAGVDERELIDTRPLVAAIADRLASARTSALSHKFGVLVDGGGAVHVRGRKHALCLGALRDVDGSVWFEVRVDGPLPLRHEAGEPVWVVDPDQVPAVVDAAVGGRRTPLPLERRGAGDVTLTTRGLSTPAVGVHPQRRPGLVWIGAVAVLGRLGASTLGGLAEVAAASGSRELRVTPWRSVVLLDVAAEDAARVVGVCQRLGLVCDATHPATAVVACAGIRGCAAGLADTQADARALVDRLAEVPVGSRPSSVHVSGCEKGCARAQPAEVSIVAGPTAGRYDLYRGKRAGVQAGRFGERVARGLDPQAAIDAVLDRGAAR